MAVDRLAGEMRQKYLADLASFLAANPDQLLELDIAIERVQHAGPVAMDQGEAERDPDPEPEQDQQLEVALEQLPKAEPGGAAGEGGEYFEFDEPLVLPNTCSSCGRNFSSRSNLNSHIRAVHLGLRVPCRLCLRQFKSRGLAEEHEAAFHRGKRFLCSECDRTFVSRSGRDSHLLYKHNGEPQSCAECDYKGRNAGQIRNHVRVEHLQVSAADCPTCFKTFKSKYEMRRHQRIHLGLRIPCDLCEKVYGSRSELQRHKKILHRGDRFECEVEGNKYTSKASLDHHRRRVHSDIL